MINKNNDEYLIEQLKNSDYIYISIWKEAAIYKLYVNEIVASLAYDKHFLKREGIRIKKLFTKYNIKVRTNLH